MKTKLRYLF